MTKWIGIIGYPLKHSPSKDYHTEKLQSQNLKYNFKVLEWQPESFGENILELTKDKDCIGFSVTMPFKERILHNIDACEPFARTVRSVNCVKNENGRWRGFNTDAPGFMKGLNTLSPKPPKRMTCVILGAGATARTLSFALAQDGYQKFILKNRTLHKAQSWAEQLKDYFPNIKVEVEAFEKPVKGKDLFLLNTTSIGTSEQGFNWRSFLNLEAPSWIFDVTCNPPRTDLVDMCRKNCFYTINGLPMFHEQADLAFKIWFPM